MVASKPLKIPDGRFKTIEIFNGLLKTIELANAMVNGPKPLKTIEGDGSKTKNH